MLSFFAVSRDGYGVMLEEDPDVAAGAIVLLDIDTLYYQLLQPVAELVAPMPSAEDGCEVHTLQMRVLEMLPGDVARLSVETAVPIDFALPPARRHVGSDVDRASGSDLDSTSGPSEESASDLDVLVSGLETDVERDKEERRSASDDAPDDAAEDLGAERAPRGKYVLRMNGCFTLTHDPYAAYCRMSLLPRWAVPELFGTTGVRG